MSRRYTTRPRIGNRVRSENPQISQCLTLEASTLKENREALQLSSSEKTTRTVAGCNGALKKQKQAWESPPNTPNLPREPTSAAEQRGTEKVQDFLYPEHLQKLKEKFQDASGSLLGELDLNEFTEFFREYPELNNKSDQDIKTFFDKIDCYSKGKIGWNSFCTYMYLELYEKEDAKTKAKEVLFRLPATPIPGPHRDSLCRLCYLHDGTVVSCSQDGTICFWTQDMKPKKKNKTETGILGKPKWISDMTLAPAQGKIILTTGDNEIQFFEMVNFEPYCQITNLESTPLKVAFWSNPINKNDCILLVGDEQGTVTIFCIPHIPEAFKIWKLGPRKKGIPTFLIDRLVMEESVASIRLFRWKLHSDWVTDLKYFGELRVFASSACDSDTSLLLGTPSGSTPVDAILRGNQYYKRRQSTKPNLSSFGGKQTILPAKMRLPGDQKVFRVNKGVTSFDYCHLTNVLVTGGMDQAIRIWNPFVTSSPIGILYGQESPIFSVKLDPSNERIYSISNDNTLKVWDLIEQNCVCTLYSATHKVHSTVEAMLFNPVSQSVILATDQLYTLPLVVVGGIPAADRVYTHRQVVTTLSYSDTFGLVITTGGGSDIKVWDISVGECVFEFASVHGNSSITAADIDSTGRRLVTSGVNGEIKIWNFNNGQCLLKLDRDNSEEVSDVKFVYVNQIKYIVAVGWDRRVNVFSDCSMCDNIHSMVSPIASWQRSTAHAHNEDITSVVLCLPNLLATASFDGEIILWNIISGYLVNRIKPPSLGEKVKSISVEEGDFAILKLLCLEKRQSRKAATLVASGPAGFVHFWNYRECRRPAGFFQATSFKQITDMATDPLNKMLVTADVKGFVALWDIEDYYTGTMATSTATPKCTVQWRAHTAAINSLLLLERQNLLLTASSDCSVRVWTTEGHYIGTLGQSTPWCIGMSSTYQHPTAPEDVLSDSLPIQLNLDREDDFSQNTSETTSQGDELVDDFSSDNHTTKDENVLSKHGLSFVVPRVDTESGKRLRHLRMNSAKAHLRGYEPPAGSYASLLFQDLEKEPSINIRDPSSHSWTKP